LWDRTASTPHQKPFLVGRRLLSKPIGTIQQLTAQSPTGKILEWDEMTQIKLYDPVVSWRKLKSGNGYLKITAWLRGKNIDKLLDQAFKELSCCNTLIVDLRNNPGGDLFLAHSFRNRFISESRTVGYIMQTLPDGSMSEKESIMAKPAAIEKRWRKPVRFLTDPLTYSASEDMLLGLQGQENIEIVGEPSGGGSGRVRLIRLIPGWILTISTAITSDIYGNCIEGRGIPVDTLVVPDRANSGNLDIVLSKADKN